MIRVGILGCGAIGSVIAEGLGERVVVLFDREIERAERLAESLKGRAMVARNFEEFINSEIDLVIEAASQEAVVEYGERVLRAGKDLMILSVGALAYVFERLKSVAEEVGRRIYIPSGAIAGVDGVKAASEYIEDVEIVTKKNPVSLGLDANRRGVVFEGSAEDAVRRYPRNLNVAATIGLAGIGLKRTRVKVIADPDLDLNEHVVRVKWRYGEMIFSIKNVKIGGRSSLLAALSAIKMVKELECPIVIGT